jgi:chromosome segregation ATPase
LAAALQAAADASAKQMALLTKQRDEARADIEAIRAQLDICVRMTRQHATVVPRFQQQLQTLRLEAAGCQEALEAAQGEVFKYQRQLEAAQAEISEHRNQIDAIREKARTYEHAYNEATSLIIPLWMRRSLPEPVKRPLRALKRMLR